MKIRHKPNPRWRIIPPDTKRLLYARHETAHAVTAWALGVPVRRISLDPERPGIHAFVRQGMGTPVENARIAIAGPLQDRADFEALGLHRSEEHDHGDHDTPAFEFWMAAGWGSSDAQAEQIKQETRNLLEAHIPARRVLIGALVDRGSLEEPEILALLGPYPEVDPETLAERAETSAAYTAALAGRAN